MPSLVSFCDPYCGGTFSSSGLSVPGGGWRKGFQSKSPYFLSPRNKRILCRRLAPGPRATHRKLAPHPPHGCSAQKSQASSDSALVEALRPFLWGADWLGLCSGPGVVPGSHRVLRLPPFTRSDHPVKGRALSSWGRELWPGFYSGALLPLGLGTLSAHV